MWGSLTNHMDYSSRFCKCGWRIVSVCLLVYGSDVDLSFLTIGHSG